MLEGHSGNIWSVVFHPSLPIILTGSEDGACKIWHSSTYRLETTLQYMMERLWFIASVKGSNHVALGYDDGTVVCKLGSEDPVASLHPGGKLIWAKGTDIQTVNLKVLDDQLLQQAGDGEPLQVAVKDMGTTEIFPQTIAHHPNGRLFSVAGDGEYVVYTAQALRNKSFGQALEFVWSTEGHYATREQGGRIKIFHDFKEVRRGV